MFALPSFDPAPAPGNADHRSGPAAGSHRQLAALLAERDRRTAGLRKLWRYYRNPRGHAAGDTAGPWAQEEGLPGRLGRDASGRPRRELVIENDIGWRVHALVDFMFARPVAISSRAADPTQAGRIETLLRAIVDRAGGVAFLQDLALLGSVYGFVDILLRRCDQPADDPTAGFKLEVVAPPRVGPGVDPRDFRALSSYAATCPWPRCLRTTDGDSADRRYEQVELWTATTYERWRVPVARRGHGAQRVAQGRNPWGRVPVVHIQNLAQPFVYEGLSDVEPLIPLQDELNTRLSDRANRVTLQSFQMYLARGLEGFGDRPIGPGQMWATDNPDASIEAFGGDRDAPSETAHIAEVREAMDKCSGVSPVAAGVVGGKVGNLSSENAIRVVLMGLMTRTEKKRITYGAGLERLCELLLHAADVEGVLRTTPSDRRVRLDWPDPMPESQTQRLQTALLKQQLGVPARPLLSELGYGEYASE